MSIYKQLNAKEKAINVINSCNTELQLNNAHRFIQLYYNCFEDYVGYHELLNLLNKKQDEEFTKSTK